MMPLRRGLPEADARISNLPRDHRGFPVPWFVQWFEDGKPGDPGKGEPDFRVADRRKLSLAIRQKRCWVCGGQLGKHLAFVIGPMCAVNRITAEPPCHLGCAVFSAKGCPFLSQPRMRRNEVGMPEGKAPPPGIMIARNPGVACVWVTDGYRLIRDNGGVLFSIHSPTDVQWYAEGQTAARAQVMESIRTGYPLLEQAALVDGPEALAELQHQFQRAMPLLPAET